jgi:hypothetical protein
MTAFSINPAEHPVTFDASWHAQNREVTLSAVQVLAAFHAVRLARKGERQPQPCAQARQFLNRTFGRRLSADAWHAALIPAVLLIRQGGR